VILLPLLTIVLSALRECAQPDQRRAAVPARRRRGDTGRRALAGTCRGSGRLATAWGPAATGDTSSLRLYLNRLRRKLEPDPSRPKHLLTEPGLGYRFQP
jgi:two-component system, OmpR family, KDP operon response regulator KdpE